MKNNTTINVAMPIELKERATKYATKKSISLNSLVRLALTEYIEKGGN